MHWSSRHTAEPGQAARRCVCLAQVTGGGELLASRPCPGVIGNEAQKFLGKCDLRRGSENRKGGFSSEEFRIHFWLSFHISSPHKSKFLLFSAVHAVPRRTRARED
jgi:hypothetical protein